MSSTLRDEQLIKRMINMQISRDTIRNLKVFFFKFVERSGLYQKQSDLRRCLEEDPTVLPRRSEMLSPLIEIAVRKYRDQLIGVRFGP
jgi:hypothetical protein